MFDGEVAILHGQPPPVQLVNPPLLVAQTTEKRDPSSRPGRAVESHGSRTPALT